MKYSAALDAVFVGWVLLLIIKGLQPRDNWLGWFMFSRARYFHADLYDRGGVVSLWDYLPHCQVMLSQRQIESLLRHIQATRQSGPLAGTVTLLLNEGTRTYRVRRCYLIPQDDEES